MASNSDDERMHDGVSPHESDGGLQDQAGAVDHPEQQGVESRVEVDDTGGTGPSVDATDDNGERRWPPSSSRIPLLDSDGRPIVRDRGTKTHPSHSLEWGTNRLPDGSQYTGPDQSWNDSFVQGTITYDE